MKTTEQKAMDIVMKFERKCGREPKDVSKTGCGYDIKSNKRLIEVKGKAQEGRIPQWINLYKKLISKLGKDIMNYYVYIVYDVRKKKGNPKLLIFPPEIVLSNLEIDTNFVFYPKRVLKEHNEIKSIEIK